MICNPDDVGIPGMNGDTSAYEWWEHDDPGIVETNAPPSAVPSGSVETNATAPAREVTKGPDFAGTCVLH